MITYSIVLLSKVHPVFFFLTRPNAFYFLFDGILNQTTKEPKKRQTWKKKLYQHKILYNFGNKSYIIRHTSVLNITVVDKNRLLTNYTPNIYTQILSGLVSIHFLFCLTIKAFFSHGQARVARSMVSANQR